MQNPRHVSALNEISRYFPAKVSICLTRGFLSGQDFKLGHRNGNLADSQLGVSTDGRYNLLASGLEWK